MCDIKNVFFFLLDLLQSHSNYFIPHKKLIKIDTHSDTFTSAKMCQLKKSAREISLVPPKSANMAPSTAESIYCNVLGDLSNMLNLFV